MKILLLTLVSISLYSQGYENLKAYKNQHPAIVEEKNSNQIIIKFKDINNFDFFEFENRYHLTLAYCIADGICIYRSKQEENIEKIVSEIKEENILKSVEIHLKKNMKIY